MNELSLNEKLGYAIDAFGAIGIGKEAALGALGSIAGESGKGFNTRAHNPNDPNGGSYGIGQWHSSRRKGLEEFAEKSKYGLDDFRTQIDWVVRELQTTYKHVAAKLRDPNITRAQAVKTWTQKYEAPKKQYEFLEKRTTYANQFAAAAAGIPVDTATPDELASIEQAVASLTGQPINFTMPDLPDLNADVSLTGANLSPTKGQYASLPNQGPMPASKPGTSAMSAFAPASKTEPTSLSAAAGASQMAQNTKAADGFDWGRFGEITGAPVQADAFDWGRMAITPNQPSLSVANRDLTPLDRTARIGVDLSPQAAPVQMAASAPTPLGSPQFGPDMIDMGRFGFAPTAAASMVSPAAFDVLASVPSPLANAYVDPMVTTAKTTPAGAKPNYATAPVSAAPAPSSLGVMETAMTGITGAVEGLFSGLTNAGKALNAGNITGAFQAMPGKPTTAATTSQEVAAKAGDKVSQPKGALGNFLDSDTTVGGFAGAMLGGYFAGPIGAIAGGLIGQGINKALDKNPDKKAADAASTEAQGIAGGVGRAVDNLFGGLFGVNKTGDLSRNHFPDAPSPPSNRDANLSGFSQSDIDGAKEWGRENPDASPGLW